MSSAKHYFKSDGVSFSAPREKEQPKWSYVSLRLGYGGLAAANQPQKEISARVRLPEPFCVNWIHTGNEDANVFITIIAYSAADLASDAHAGAGAGNWLGRRLFRRAVV
jgi:hypothetical protein